VKRPNRTVEPICGRIKHKRRIDRFMCRNARTGTSRGRLLDLLITRRTAIALRERPSDGPDQGWPGDRFATQAVARN
jgi:hypothetical protein